QVPRYGNARRARIRPRSAEARERDRGRCATRAPRLPQVLFQCSQKLRARDVQVEMSPRKLTHREGACCLLAPSFQVLATDVRIIQTSVRAYRKCEWGLILVDVVAVKGGVGLERGQNGAQHG